ncbi:hypothetical protein RJZ56_000014 [Blastomyces dermatitidis]|uniref:Uncharacterized protein n=2 Tax=Ajellomyces dermatitidis TaxID=5039 RepID=F2TDD2_AJEDA|nr:uncharacterized protein BDCG_01194 [Blastomyces dermatitidis ER-3]EEQ84389.1 hypothetical protein BDCG_01194 [Blastomyces dermatitidis ER-3]EGE81245.1 hypothetical protein BDDG_04186 [Blastomyces dermatitidis ATCC 18188]EQL36905.1 hypothetical protein BDFG_01539 [Blastomyces dermatitidis ATCC 26199]
MPPDRSCFTALNLPPSFSFPERMDYFTLAAAPNTDLWRKPPDGDTSTAPILFTSLLQPFVIAEVTVTADWEMEWDQGGLVIFAGPAPSQQTPPRSNIGRNNVNDNNTHIIPSAQSPREQPAPPPYPQAPRHTPCKWVKAGLEFSSGTVNASSVSATADGADWCLSPLAMPNQPTTINSLRIKLERVGHSLWVWYQLPSAVTPYPCTPGALSNTWRKLREVTWFFWGVEDKSVHVGVYASRPANFSMNSSAWATRNRSRFVRDATQGPGQGAGTGAGGNGTGNHPMVDGTGPDGLVVEFEDLEIF